MPWHSEKPRTKITRSRVRYSIASSEDAARALYGACRRTENILLINDLGSISEGEICAVATSDDFEDFAMLPAHTGGPVVFWGGGGGGELRSVVLRPDEGPNRNRYRVCRFRDHCTTVPGSLHQGDELRGMQLAVGQPRAAVSGPWCFGAFPSHGYGFCSEVYFGTSFRSAWCSWPEASRYRG